MTCTKTEIEVHTHSSGCYTNGVLTCGKMEIHQHTHTDTCFETVDDAAAESDAEKEPICGKEEHEHDESCYSDATADIETSDDWERTFENIELTGVYADDLLEIAKSQLGYAESTKNYIINEEDSRKKGYSRYGDWYGDKYGDWCAMYVSFCLSYSEVVGVPYESNCQDWIDILSDEKYDLYAEASEYTPKVGDIIFFDWQGDGVSDHVGIVAEVTEATETEPAKVKTIEGNSSDRVEYNTYNMNSAYIVGYAMLPEHETGYDCGYVEHTHDEYCYNGGSRLLCQVEEHTHDDTCLALEPLTEEEQAEVDAVIAAIDALPTADEFDEKLLEFEEAEDMEGYEAYWVEVQEQGAKAYLMYEDLNDAQKAYITNIDKLMDLEWLWSVSTLLNDVAEIKSATPTPTWYTSTKDFIELNLYDYVYGINNNYDSDHKYPGFQWNGGAYAKSDYMHDNSSADDGIPDGVVDRNYIDSIDFGNSMITNYQYAGSDYGKSTTSMGIGRLYNYSSAANTGKINWLWYNGSSYKTTTNRPVGVSTGYQSISNTLGDDGYPALLDGTSLGYLFTGGSYVIKQNTESIDGLFQQDSVSGEYRYNSRENHAQYSNNFFTLYDEIITPNFITYPFGNFLPFNSITNSADATQVSAFNYDGGVQDYVEGIIADLEEALARDDDGNGTTADYGDTSRSQLITMLEEYRENWTLYPTSLGAEIGWEELSAANAIRDYFAGDSGADAPSSDISFVTPNHLYQMYNIDWDVATNFFFGMEMKMNFMMPKNGYTGNDTNGDGASDYPMVFEFTGDDDVWVYIDGVLFLDLTGIHRHVGGKIDFVNGKVHYYELDVENGGDVSSTPYKTYTFAEILSAAGKDTSVLNSNGTFEDYSTHSFNFYYMERGSGSSVCRLNFNFPLLKKNSISVIKENVSDVETLGNTDYYFNIVTPENELFIQPDTTYKILDSSGNQIGTGTVDQYGIFTLKAGQTAVFEDVEENSGEYFVQELIKEEDNAQYDEVLVNGTAARYGSLIQWDYRTYFSDSDDDTYTGPYGYKWYGYSGADTDASSNRTFYFEAQNGVATDKLGKLSITKQLAVYDDSISVKDASYKMYVTLDNTPLPVGTVYTIGDTENTVSTAGYIELKAGETATISNIISGTKFVVKEDEASSKGYSVTYEVVDADEVIDDGSSIAGVIRADTTVAVTVKNDEKGVSVTIPGTKNISYPDNSEYEFKFLLQEVTDSSGETEVADGAKLESVNKVTESAEFNFELKYLESDFETLPAKRYYKIIEIADSETEKSVMYDSSVYVIEVIVSQSDETLSAEITNAWKDGTEITSLSDLNVFFTNTLIRDLTIEKQLPGVSLEENKVFTFEVALTQNNLPLTGTYNVSKSDTEEIENVVFDADGKAVVSVTAGQSLTIHGLPYGASWRITETNATGYKVTYQIVNSENDTVEQSYDGEIAEGTIVDSNKVIFTNYTAYVLPETGGFGTQIYILAGLMLAGITLYLLYKNKNSRKEVS